MPFTTKPPVYNVWSSMKDRCLNPRFKQWAGYGGRGISVCDRWLSYELFELDMGPRPAGYSLDRIDNNLGYSPENCRWADKKTQQRNRRCAVFVEIEGKSYRVIDLVSLTGRKAETIMGRASKGMTYEQVIHSGSYSNSETLRAKLHTCPKGHPKTPENVYITPQGWRVCKTCHRAKTLRQSRTRRAAI